MSDTMANRLQVLLAHLEGAYAPNTLRAYRADMLEFIGFCQREGEVALPAQAETVAKFTQVIAGKGLKSATIRRKLYSVSAVHRLSDLEDPTRHPEVKLALRKMHRRLGRAMGQAYGITLPLLNQLLAVAGDDLRGLRDKALLMLAYGTMLRRSELARLRFEDLEVADENVAGFSGMDPAKGGALIFLRRSKTDQELEGRWMHLSAPAVAAVVRWKTSAQLYDGPILRGVQRGGVVSSGLGEGQISRIFKRLARQAGVSEAVVGEISAHSLRVGGAQDMVRGGASLAQIMVRGGWSKSDTVMRYVEKACLAFTGNTLLG